MLSYFRIEMKIKQVISRRLVPFHKRACKPSQMPHDYGSDVVATPIQIQHSTTEASRARTPGNAHSRARMKTEAHSFITIIIMINKEAQNDCEQRRKDRYRRYQATDLFQTIWNNKLPSTLLTFYRSRCTIYMSLLIYETFAKMFDGLCQGGFCLCQQQNHIISTLMLFTHKTVI